MISRYTVVQYFPNPLSGERINIGIIAWNEDRIACRFVGDWRRVRGFGREDIGFLRHFVERVEEAAHDPVLPSMLGDNFNQAKLEKIIGSWINSIQFSEPRVSLKSSDELIAEIVPVFLRERPRRPKPPRDRRAAVTVAAHSLLSVLREHIPWGHADNLLKRNHLIEGKFDQHEFDVVVTNGRPFLAAQALSFELRDRNRLETDIDAIAWSIDDVRKRNPRLPLAVVVLPPKSRGEGQVVFERAKNIFEGLHADVETETEIDRWAKRVVKRIPRQTLP